MEITDKEKHFLESYDTVWIDGIERGKVMSSFLDEEIIALKNRRILDLGCGPGGISIAFSDKSGQVIGGDFSQHFLSVAKQRSTQMKKNNLFFSRLSAIKLPFKNETFDIVIMNGVLEHVGAIDMSVRPKLLQKQSLEEIKRILKKDGILYIGIENRIYYRNIFKDPHTKVPLVCWLPRRLADVVFKIIGRKRYSNYIYSSRGMKKLLSEGGYVQIKNYIPLFSYQYPVTFKNESDRNGILEFINFQNKSNLSKEYINRAFPTRKGILKYKIAASLNLINYFSSDFVFICWK